MKKCSNCKRPAEDRFKLCRHCRDTIKKRQRLHYDAGRCRCGQERVAGTKRCTTCLARARKIAREGNDRARADALKAFGNACACCGETYEPFLALDHVQGGGGKERKQFPHSRMLYRWVAKQGFPKDRYQLLCHNCNFCKGAGPACTCDRGRVATMIHMC